MFPGTQVDDYYSNVGSTSASDSKASSPKKPLIKAKKKVMKKVVPKVEEKPKEEKIETPKNTQAPKPKKVQQKIGLVSRVKSDTQENTSHSPAQKTNDSTSTPSTGFTPKKSFKKSSIGNEKKKKESEQENKKQKSFLKSKTRGKVNFISDEQEFTRSNKVNKRKKQEKQVEDIKQTLTVRTGETVIVSDVLSLKELSEKIGVPLAQLIAEFMKNGMMVNINSQIDFDSANIVAEAFEIKLQRDDSAGLHIDDIMTGDISTFLQDEDTDALVSRPPVISIMGHVDHGKTSLLDYIRKAKIAAGEAGGITQSIGAYQVEQENGKITFLDTPGHEAFTVMRARGAKSTDIAILVVAADEGVKPQTIESINHAKEADIPVIVAINKMDKEGANPDHVKGQLSEHGLTPEDWGGDTPMVPVSAHTGFGIDELLEIILLVAEMKELKANPERNGIATVIESHLDTKLGPVATLLVNTGHIDAGDHIVCEDAFGKVKVLRDYMGHNVKKSLPGEPVFIVGLDKVVEGGNILQVVPSAEVARQKSLEYKTVLESKARDKMSNLDILMSRIKAGSLKQLKLIVKADTNGSLEAIKNALIKLSTEETSVSVIHSGVGNINEGDILMGEGSEAILIGFNVGVLSTAKSVLESSGVEFISSEIIYHITERIEKIITGMLDPKEVEVVLGKAKVGGIFYTSKEFMILGLKVGDETTIENNTMVRVIRDKKMVGHGKITSLKQGVEEVNQIEGPTECGIRFEGDMQPLEKDQLEIYKIEIH
ncbi:translation initiation factor IF-2 [Candidatus Gracilibacteria bacterium]|nr:translation initiation factor IF-2 [Candidatus Gracilibacteria bacterium]